MCTVIACMNIAEYIHTYKDSSEAICVCLVCRNSSVLHATRNISHWLMNCTHSVHLGSLQDCWDFGTGFAEESSSDEGA